MQRSIENTVEREASQSFFFFIVPDVSLGDYRSLRNQGPLSVGVSVCLSFCDAWVCTDHEIYVVAVIVAL